MSKRRLINREQLNKELKKAEPGSVSRNELMAVKVAIENPKPKVVRELLKSLKSSTSQIAKHFVAAFLGNVKDPRVISPLFRAALAPENANHSSNFLWPMEKYDCSKYAGQLVKLLLTRLDCDEVVWACVEVIRAMKGPLEPSVARRLVRQLLTEVKAEMNPNDLTELHAFRLEAADKIMALYFNNTLHTFWSKWNNGKWPTTEVSNPAS